MSTLSNLKNTLFESIRLIDGETPLLKYHQKRVDRSYRLAYGRGRVPKLAKLIEEMELPRAGLHKLRIRYDQEGSSYEVCPYAPRPVDSLKLVDADAVRYPRKWSDRSGIDACFQRRGGCDDIIMIQHGFVTDSSYANLAFFDGHKWYTPAWPLLRGTRRRQLLDAGKILPSVIREKDLVHFERVRLINALLPWGDGPEVARERVVR